MWEMLYSSGREAEGREIVDREGLQPKTAGLDPDLWAASVALGRYDAAHME
jgi:hypothetical protein